MHSAELSGERSQRVSTLDIVALDRLRDLNAEALGNDVQAIRGEPVVVIIERTEVLKEKIARGLGVVPSTETVKVGFVSVDEDQERLLQSGRRVMPEPKKLY